MTTVSPEDGSRPNYQNVVYVKFISDNGHYLHNCSVTEQPKSNVFTGYTNRLFKTIVRRDYYAVGPKMRTSYTKGRTWLATLWIIDMKLHDYAASTATVTQQVLLYDTFTLMKCLVYGSSLGLFSDFMMTSSPDFQVAYKLYLAGNFTASHARILKVFDLYPVLKTG
jgi:hypothetical protein